MILKNLHLKNFRNHSKKEISFSPEINLIVGPNAAGKTNILEAVFLLASGKSFRVRGTESEMIETDREMANVKGQKADAETLEIILTRGEVMGIKTSKKKYLVNGVARKATDFIGHLRAVYFGPEDLQIILGSPSVRRHFLDMVLSQVDREYTRVLLSYEKGLRTRNRLLEEMRESGLGDKKRLFFWDQLLIKNGNLITARREEFLNFINGFQNYFKTEYDRSTISPERLAQYEKEEVLAGTTLVGPHRDDFKILAEERDLSIYGSRGEERLAVLWLKLSELAFMTEKTKEEPILLLDDIFSELDPKHRQIVLNLVQTRQTIITTTDLAMVDSQWLSGVKIISV